MICFLTARLYSQCPITRTRGSPVSLSHSLPHFPYLGTKFPLIPPPERGLPFLPFPPPLSVICCIYSFSKLKRFSSLFSALLSVTTLVSKKQWYYFPCLNTLLESPTASTKLKPNSSTLQSNLPRSDSSFTFWHNSTHLCFGHTKLFTTSWPQHPLPCLECPFPPWNPGRFLQNPHPFTGQLRRTLCCEALPNPPKHKLSLCPFHRHLSQLPCTSLQWFAITRLHVSSLQTERLLKDRNQVLVIHLYTPMPDMSMWLIINLRKGNMNEQMSPQLLPALPILPILPLEFLFPLPLL